MKSLQATNGLHCRVDALRGARLRAMALPRAKLTVLAATKGFGSAKAPPSTGKAPQTCPCGSKIVYRECCEQYHEGKSKTANIESTLRARFSAFSKGEEDFLLATDKRTNVSADQLKRDITYAANNYAFTGLKITSIEETSPSSGVAKFQYNSKQATKERRTNSRTTKEKAPEPERNLDGSIKVNVVREKSTFELRDGAWVLVASEFES